MQNKFNVNDQVIVVKNFIADNKESLKGISGYISDVFEKFKLSSKAYNYSYSVKLEDNDVVLKEEDLVLSNNISAEELNSMINERSSLNDALKLKKKNSCLQQIDELMTFLKNLKDDVNNSNDLSFLANDAFLLDDMINNISENS